MEKELVAIKDVDALLTRYGVEESEKNNFINDLKAPKKELTLDPEDEKYNKEHEVVEKEFNSPTERESVKEEEKEFN